MTISTRVDIRRIDGGSFNNEWVIHLIEPETELRAFFFIYEPFFNQESNRYDFYYLPYGRDQSLEIIAIDGPFTLSQSHTVIEAGGTLENIRPQRGVSDKNPVITYDAANDPDNTASGTIIFKAADDNAPTGTVRLVTRCDFTPQDADNDNTIDRSDSTAPENIASGRGRDTITAGRLNDLIEPGLDDDRVDLSADSGDRDTITYRVGGTSRNIIAFDGGDMITGFIPGRDRIDFGLPTEDSTTEAPDPAMIEAGYGTSYIAMPVIEYRLHDPLLSAAGRQDAAGWANYLFTGIEIHFNDALVLASGRLTGAILTILFDPDYAIRGDIFLSKAGDGFDDQSFTFTDLAVIDSIYANEFTARAPTREDSSRDAAVHHDIYEHHPASKPVLTLEADSA